MHGTRPAAASLDAAPTLPLPALGDFDAPLVAPAAEPPAAVVADASPTTVVDEPSVVCVTSAPSTWVDESLFATRSVCTFWRWVGRKLAMRTIATMNPMSGP